MIRVDTRQYEVVHGHKPRQPRGSRRSRWAVRVDTDPTIIWIDAAYPQAIAQAKQRAQYSITVLP